MNNVFELLDSLKKHVKFKIIIFIRFCIIGIITAGIQLITYSVLLLIHLNYQLASFFGLFIATTLAYFGNRMWTFQSKNQLFRELIQFYLSRLITVPINALILFFVISILRMNTVMAQIFSIGIITLLNFYIGKTFIFRKAIV
ncbi:GtrA family protein [Ferroacidibacillus organovorans]|uniref:GtrA/DPMS transmembrane domain-containing protein n=1 Tax=Ferroacidibacillus organovorans TaxID=1765683 RepID=A0A853KAF0_9BACL|nr:hypothetical protein AYJ22_14240 [Ferroacidibacillus organovorans]OAG93441.1 hypothetical protein AYW79_10675 [Ferroacidibacillus organovorans]